MPQEMSCLYTKTCWDDFEDNQLWDSCCLGEAHEFWDYCSYEHAKKQQTIHPILSDPKVGTDLLTNALDDWDARDRSENWSGEGQLVRVRSCQQQDSWQDQLSGRHRQKNVPLPNLGTGRGPVQARHHRYLPRNRHAQQVTTNSSRKQLCTPPRVVTVNRGKSHFTRRIQPFAPGSLSVAGEPWI